MHGARPDAEEATRIAAGVADRLGTDADVELLRSGMNQVFRAGDVVIRVAAADVEVQAHVVLARWLRDEGLPVARPVADAIDVDGAAVSVWEHVEQDPGASIDFEQLGRAIARLHRIPRDRLPADVALPWCGAATWLQLEPLLAAAATAEVVDAQSIRVLADECHALDDWQAQARAEPRDVCHGDVDRHAAEARRRMRYWLGDPHAPAWTPQ